MTDVIKLMRAWLDIVAVGPVEAWRAQVADDVVVRLPYAPPGVDAEKHGREKVIEMMAPVWAGKSSFNWVDVVMLKTEDPDLVVTTCRSDAVMLDGRKYGNNYVMFTRFRDGKVF